MGFGIKKRRKTSPAQGVIEFSVAFIVIVLLLFSIIDCAVFYQAFHSAQTFSDEVDFNLNAIGMENICSLSTSEPFDIVEARAKKYLQKDLELSIKNYSESHVYIESDDSYLGNKILTVRIGCNPSTETVSVRANYLYRGFFIFRAGRIISTISSVQTPKF